MAEIPCKLASCTGMQPKRAHYCELHCDRCKEVGTLFIRIRGSRLCAKCYEVWDELSEAVLCALAWEDIGRPSQEPPEA